MARVGTSGLRLPGPFANATDTACNQMKADDGTVIRPTSVTELNPIAFCFNLLKPDSAICICIGLVLRVQAHTCKHD